MAAGINLGDADVWDDSALIRSWDEAHNEYKKYHSIHARGEKVEDVLEKHELEQLRREQRRQQNGGATYGAADEEEEEEDELVDGEQAMDIETGADDEHDGAATSGSLTQQVYAKPETPAATAGAAPMPEIVLGTIKDDATKNLVMSWYYAGYYTGLQESLQKAAATTDAGKKGS